MCSAIPLFCTAILGRRSSSSIQVTHKLFINECVSHTPELSISASWIFHVFSDTHCFDAWFFLLSTKVQYLWQWTHLLDEMYYSFAHMAHFLALISWLAVRVRSWCCRPGIASQSQDVVVYLASALNNEEPIGYATLSHNQIHIG
jgi:hypothetical protein